MPQRKPPLNSVDNIPFALDKDGVPIDHEYEQPQANARSNPAASQQVPPRDAGPTTENTPSSAATKGPSVHNGFRNSVPAKIAGDKARKTPKFGLSVCSIFESLMQLAGNWPKCANGMLFVEGIRNEPEWIKKPSELFAWIGGRLKGDRNRIEWAKGPDKVSESQFHAFILQNSERYEAVEAIPHYPAMPHHFYMHPALKGGDGKALRQLLARFSPATPADYDLIETAFLTPFSGIEPGQRPAFLISAEGDDKHGGRGTGKTSLVKLIGRLCGGHIELRSSNDWDKIVTRLLSPAALAKRVVLLDNVKSLRFSWADLEGGITSNVISGKQLYVGEGRRPNTLTYFITLNGANLSKDLAQRCVPIVLKRPDYDPTWENNTIEFIEAKRWEIIGDIVAKLQGLGALMSRVSRWGPWESAVLSRVADPVECQKVIEERQAEFDDDQCEADIVREGIREELLRRGHNPDIEVVWIPSRDAAQIINRLENEEKRPYNRAMTHLYTLAIPELRRSNRRGERGCVWTGSQADPSIAAGRLRSFPP